jgi:hypothetical protein
MAVQHAQADSDFEAAEIILEHAKYMFGQYASDYNSLDGKATGFVGFAGIATVLGGVATSEFSSGMLRDTVTALSILTFGCFIGFLLFLFAVFVLCLRCMQVRRVAYPATVAELIRCYKSLETAENRNRRFVKEMAKSFASVNADMRDKVLNKAQWLRGAGICMFLSMSLLLVSNALLLYQKMFLR